MYCIIKVGDVKTVQINCSQYSRCYDLFKEGTVLPIFDSRQSGETEGFLLNDRRPRLYHELDVFVSLVVNHRYEQAEIYNQHTLDVMEVLDEARHQVGIIFQHD